MPTTIYDSSLLTKRRMEKAQSGNFISRIQNGVNSTTGYAPALGIYDQSIINNVKLGQMTDIKKCGGAYIVDTGCPCGANSTGPYLTSGTINSTNNVNNVPIVLTFDENSPISNFTILYPDQNGETVLTGLSNYYNPQSQTYFNSPIQAEFTITGTIPEGAQIINSSEFPMTTGITLYITDLVLPSEENNNTGTFRINRTPQGPANNVNSNIKFDIVFNNRILARSNKIRLDSF